ncbi:LacI family DNA-binding transcriptional regulator [Cryobacterium zhongshanensis]|uniref:LacI family transcriptional regulator n=1 Tax=Cryobacterium zhongshanensis TaxID=2928153 RepID=A0AA41UIZ2_9MICO|nr:LacI family DNA-binding transcriptional regulator [Cryobacterium zhongshanensis]MCI4660084.1 LacI family transcriptional regulator [Cryobacterium zhongshanensis]
MSDSGANTPTVDDVARLAGVSIATVSRVLNGSARVSDDKLTRVRAAVHELGFRPNPAARSLAGRHARIIAVLAGTTSRFEQVEIIRGIEESSRAAGYLMSLTAVGDADDDSIDQALSLVLDQAVAGVIVLTSDAVGVAALRRIPEGILTVTVSGMPQNGVPHVSLDEPAAAGELVAYLLGLGHTTVHCVGVPASPNEDERILGWRRALRAAGAATPEVIHSSEEPNSGCAIGRQLARSPGVTAVFCGSDVLAMEVMHGLAEAGKSVPDEVSVVGFGDHPLAALWRPALTTVNQDFAGLGNRAFLVLDGLISGPLGRTFASAAPALVVRDSAASPVDPGGAALT